MTVYYFQQLNEIILMITRTTRNMEENLKIVERSFILEI